jgi:hypothetical protein
VFSRLIRDDLDWLLFLIAVVALGLVIIIVLSLT